MRERESIVQRLTVLSFPRQVNLDVTTLLSLVSNLTHGRHHFRFEDAVLNAQAAQERRAPSLPRLTAFLEGESRGVAPPRNSRVAPLC